MTKTLYAATSKYVEEINNLPVKRQVSVSGILKKLDVSRSGYNAWKKRVPSDTSIRRTVLKEKIQKIYDDSHQNYGAPKIAAELRKSGETITEKTVGNYMRQMGIKAQWIKPYTQTTIDSDLSQKLKNILNEKFNPEHPDAVWCSDITYIPIKRGFLYLTAVIDWYSRCIVGWEVDDTLDTRMVINALKKAFKTAKPVILNSDQGCQFTSNEYMNFLKENQIRQSMDGKSRWADNIMIERWFRSFKYEEAYLTQYANIREARKAIGKYIHTYNFERCHSAINNQTPASYYYPVLLIEYAA